mmetsp:Transcript_7724/g.7277  ORF Transcript_7724/g.7277 Transcript_7724/m.7277 type:complete len:116 (+) Transcript_7724:1432-1779(+)
MEKGLLGLVGQTIQCTGNKDTRLLHLRANNKRVVLSIRPMSIYPFPMGSGFQAKNIIMKGPGQYFHVSSPQMNSVSPTSMYPLPLNHVVQNQFRNFNMDNRSQPNKHNMYDHQYN